MGAEILIQGEITGLPTGSKKISVRISDDNPIGQVTDVDLALGANTITVPSAADGVVIVPPASNTSTIILKGVTGDTGVGISPSAPTLLMFSATPPASFVLTAGAAIAGVELSFF